MQYITNCLNTFKKNFRQFLSKFDIKKIFIIICIGFTLFTVFFQLYFSTSTFQKRNAMHHAFSSQAARMLIKELNSIEENQQNYETINDFHWLPDNYALVVKNNLNETIYSTGHFPENMTFPVATQTFKALSSNQGTLYIEKSEQTHKYIFFPHDTTLKKALLSQNLFIIIIIILFFILLYRCFINPLITIDKILQNAIEGDFNYNYKTLQHSTILHTTYSNLEVLLTDIKQLTTKEAHAQLVMKQAEINALQSQINPHFLYNTLDAIRGQAFQYGAKDIQSMTLALSKLFRYSISNQKRHVTLEEELSNIDNYLMIQQIRFCNKFIIKNQIETDTLHCKIPKLIIQPIVENAVHHGLEPKRGSGTLTLRSYRTQSRLIIEIKDDGVGMSPSKAEQLNHSLAYNLAYHDKTSGRTSVGLTNTNARIKLCFGSEYGITIHSTPSIGSNIILNLPIQEDK